MVVVNVGKELTESDENIALWAVIINGILIVTTLIYFGALMIGIFVYKNSADVPWTKLPTYLTSPLGMAATLMLHGYVASPGPETIYWNIASVCGALGYLLNIWVLVVSILGLKVRNISNLSWYGYLIGIGASGIAMTVLFNMLLWWIPGFILTIGACYGSLRTYRQIRKLKKDQNQH